jgi:RNA polymerase sigma-70 factor (ECF subfamily)
MESTATVDDGNEDAALVRAARSGDRGAFAALLARHRPLVVALCGRALGDSDLAEDAAQEAALQAMLDLDRLRQPERFGPWLAGIGLNVCRRWRRSRARDIWSLDAVLGGRFAPEPELTDVSPGPAELAETAEERALVRRAVAGLPPGQRAAVVLHYLAGLPLAESAALLGVAPNAVKARLHKARANLRRVLAAPLECEEAEMDDRISRRTLTRAAGALAGTAAVGQLASPAAMTAGNEVGGGSSGVAWVEMRVAEVRRRPRARATPLRRSTWSFSPKSKATGGCRSGSAPSRPKRWRSAWRGSRRPDRSRLPSPPRSSPLPAPACARCGSSA